MSPRPARRTPRARSPVPRPALHVLRVVLLAGVAVATGALLGLGNWWQGGLWWGCVMAVAWAIGRFIAASFR